jgi:hypothetical protein
MPTRDSRQTAPRAWKFLLPWAVLPLALAIIAAADWLKHGRKRTQRKEAG